MNLRFVERIFNHHSNISLLTAQRVQTGIELAISQLPDIIVMGMKVLKKNLMIISREKLKHT